MLTGRGYFNTEYVYKEAVQPDGDAPFDYKTFVENQIPFQMGSVRADTGETVNWGREDIPDFKTLMMYIRASSTIPGMMPMPYIDGIPYIDGPMGSSGGIPIDIAEQGGFDKFLVILTRPRGFRRKPTSRSQVLRRFFRKTPMVAELMISRHERYNASRKYIEQLERQGKLMSFMPMT